MAKKKEEADAPSVENEIGGDAQTAPREQTQGDTDQPQLQSNTTKPLALAGDKKVKINPALHTLSVSIPTGTNEDGTTKFDEFLADKPYEVDPTLLELKNTEDVPFFIEEGGE